MPGCESTQNQVWTEILNDTQYMDTILPVNVVLLAILGGIIGLVLGMPKTTQQNNDV
jgi:hypothetical protein